jgi:hypothetical protein
VFIDFYYRVSAMDKQRKSLGSVLILVVAISCMTLLMVKFVNAQSVPVPEFTVKYVPSSYNTIDPYTGIIKQVDNSSIVLSIKNEPLYYQGQQAIIYYNVTTKGHFEADDWTPTNPVGFNLNLSEPIYNLLPSTSTNLGTPSSDSSFTNISIPANRYDPNSKVDFAVQEFELTSSQVQVYPPNGGNPGNETAYYLVGTSNRSSIQTITIPASSASPTPSIPEMPTSTILPLLLSSITIAATIIHMKVRSSLALPKVC